MTQGVSFFRGCSRGFYSCHWRRESDEKKKCSCCWLVFVGLATMLSLCWMYVCLVTYNDRDDVNWKGFQFLKVWVNWFMVLIIVFGVLTSYCLLLLLFALVQVALREELDLHWLHKIFLSLGVIFIISGVAGISCMWKREWPTVPLSLQATAPFLQFGAVGALTLLCPFVFHAFIKAKKGSKFLIAAVFLVVSAAIFLCPLLIKSPCLMAGDLPEKPKFVGHRGAPMYAPENTMMSFNKSVECNVTAFETDVQVSKDGIPFLMHDHNKSGFLERTTNVKKVFPDMNFSTSSDVTSEDLGRLNAGEWFLETDPYHTVSQLTELDKERARTQVVPTLLQLLQFAQQHQTAVIFDLYSEGENDTDLTVKTIRQSGIDHSLVYWLPSKKRKDVMDKDPGFVQVYENESDVPKEEGHHHLNVKYSNLSVDKIRKLRSRNVTVNLWVVNERWLFSLLWCAGASSVTTNSCHLLKDMEKPDWTMTPSTYRTIWIIVDVASVLIMTFLYILQLRRCSRHRGEVTGNNIFTLKEMKQTRCLLPK